MLRPLSLGTQTGQRVFLFSPSSTRLSFSGCKLLYVLSGTWRVSHTPPRGGTSRPGFPTPSRRFSVFQIANEKRRNDEMLTVQKTVVCIHVSLSRSLSRLSPPSLVRYAGSVSFLSVITYKPAGHRHRSSPIFSFLATDQTGTQGTHPPPVFFFFVGPEKTSLASSLPLAYAPPRALLQSSTTINRTHPGCLRVMYRMFHCPCPNRTPSVCGVPLRQAV